MAADVAAERGTADFRAGFRDLTDGDSRIDTVVFPDDAFAPGDGSRLVVVYRRP